MISPRSVITIERHIVEEERKHPHATGAFSDILYEVTLAVQLISREVRRAGLIDIHGKTGDTNVHGEEVKKLDDFAHDVIFRALDHGGQLCLLASEEADDPIEIPPQFATGNYVFLYDPLDGSSNIDANISVGTIFSVHRKISQADRGTLEDCLQPGLQQVAAGYVIYGSSTMLVYSAGPSVTGFTLDPSIGEFVLSHPDLRIPSPGQRIYSVNEGNYTRWSEGQRRFVDHLKGVDGKNKQPFSSRYIGSLVGDFHRTLLYGGIFMYPGDNKNPRGKLRVLYEAAPLGFIAEQAGGRAIDGECDVLDYVPRSLHDRTPLYVGSKEYVDLAEEFLKADKPAAAAR